MPPLELKVTRIDKDLPLPSYQTQGAVAFDLYCRTDETIAPGEIKLLPSNLIIQVPEGYGLILASRSGGPKKGLTPPHGFGLIDQDYHGPEDEVKIQVRNFTSEPVRVKRGDRIAQAFLAPVPKVNFLESEILKKESRGGFGSTG